MNSHLILHECSEKLVFWDDTGMWHHPIFLFFLVRFARRSKTTPAMSPQSQRRRSDLEVQKGPTQLVIQQGKSASKKPSSYGRIPRAQEEESPLPSFPRLDPGLACWHPSPGKETLVPRAFLWWRQQTWFLDVFFSGVLRTMVTPFSDQLKSISMSLVGVHLPSLTHTLVKKAKTMWVIIFSSSFVEVGFHFLSLTPKLVDRQPTAFNGPQTSTTSLFRVVLIMFKK